MATVPFSLLLTILAQSRPSTQQPPAQLPPSPIARLIVTPANPTMVSSVIG